MRTFADVKKRLQVGAILVLEAHSFGHRAVGLPRKVAKRQSNAIMFEGGSWLQFPKASEVQTTGTDSFTITCHEEGQNLVLAYRFVTEAEQPQDTTAAGYNGKCGVTAVKQMRKYNFGGYAGCVVRRRSRQTGRLVGLYYAPEAGLDCGINQPWTTLCEEHGMIAVHATLAMARRHLADPLGWCEACMLEH